MDTVRQKNRPEPLAIPGRDFRRAGMCGHFRNERLGRMANNGEWSARETRLKHAGTGGVVLGTISASYLWNFYGNFEVGRHSGITLLYADGHVIARNPDNANEAGRNLSHKPLFQNLFAAIDKRHLQFHWGG
jgi:hypothetical protein